MPWLTVTIFLPLAGVVALLAWPGLDDRRARLVGLVTTIVTFGFSLGILASFDRSNPGFQLVDHAVWVKSANLQYIVGVDGISLWLVLLTTFLFPIALLAAHREVRDVRRLMVAFLFLESTLLGVFLSLDLLLFFLFFEAMLFPMYLIIGGWGGERRASAAIKFFLYTMFGSAFLFVGILFLYFQAGSITGTPTFDLRVLQHLALPIATGRWLFLAFLVAFAVKVPLVPLHTWLPDAYTESPTSGLVLLAGVLPKVGAFALIRFNLALFPEASRYFHTLVAALAITGIIYGAVVALIQTDVKRLVAYSSISHLGFAVLGVFVFTQTALSGSVLELVNHGLTTAALFLLVQMVADRTRTRDLREMGGMSAVTPRLAGVFLLVALASVGLPGLNHFVGEWLVILGTFAFNNVFAALAATGVVLSAIYLLWAYQRMMHGPLRAPIAGGAHAEDEGRGLPPPTRIRPDLRRFELALLVPLIALMVVIGVYPKPFLDRINPATARATTQAVQVGNPAGGP